jgi:preprotein translocase subunit SecG
MLLYYIFAVLHVLVCLILILVVLLQSGKGADLAGAFGGGGTQTAFGSRGPASFLSRATTVAAVVFMITSILLAGMSTRDAARSIMENAAKGTTQSTPKQPTTTQGESRVPTLQEIKRRQDEYEAKQKQPPAALTLPPAKEAQPEKAPPPATKKVPD